jgi:hypothetical protein
LTKARRWDGEVGATYGRRIAGIGTFIAKFHRIMALPGGNTHGDFVMEYFDMFGTTGPAE